MRIAKVFHKKAAARLSEFPAAHVEALPERARAPTHADTFRITERTGAKGRRFGDAEPVDLDAVPCQMKGADLELPIDFLSDFPRGVAANFFLRNKSPD